MSDRQDAAWQSLANRLGVAVSPAQEEALEAFWALLLTWNARINLTGARGRDELVGEHLPDSVAMASLVARDARVLDVGSGGGLPAVPLAVLRPDLRLQLVEPRAKRVAFLRTAVRTLRLSAEVLDGRVEDVGHHSAEVAGSRATFAPREWLERARVLAPRALVFAARRSEVEVPPGWTLEADVEYETAARHGRWLGRYCST